MLIAVEGIDGCGKDTQLLMLADYYRSQGKTVEIIREPDEDNPIGLFLRECLKAGKNQDIMALLFTADRYLTLKQKIEPLEDNAVILSSRSFLSTLVYQQDTWSKQWLEETCRYLPIYDHVFYVDITAETAMSRITSRDKPVEVFEKLHLLQEYRNRYLRVIRGETFQNIDVVKKYSIINGNASADKIHLEIRRICGQS